MEWIPIENGHPEHRKEVLISITYNEIPVQAYWDNEYNVWVGSQEVREWMNDIICRNATLIVGGIGATVTHWCELPEPPKII